MKKITLNSGLEFRTDEVSVRSLLTFITIKNDSSEPQVYYGNRGIHWTFIPHILLESVQADAIYEFRTDGDTIKITLHTKDIVLIDEVL